MIRIKEHIYSEAPIATSIVKYMEEQIQIVFEEDGNTEIVTLAILYENRAKLGDEKGENWLTGFEVHSDVGRAVELTDRSTVADDVIELLKKDIPQQTVLHDVCNYIDKVVDEALKKHNIFEE